MAEASVDVPKIGKVKKVYFWGALGGAGLYVGWRWYSANRAETEDVTYDTDEVGDTLPTGGAGAAGGSGNVQYAGSSTDATSADVIDTNAEWTNRAVELLSNAGYDAATVYGALGDFLAKRPLSSEEQTIARAALAAVGQPPTGGPFPITEQVGETSLTAPAGLRAWDKATASQIGMQWNPVPGASHYRIYRTDLGNEPIGDSFDTKFWARGLGANKSYTFKVAAVSGLNKTGPQSAAFTAKTSGATLKAPTGLLVRTARSTAIDFAWSPVAGAGGYLIQQSGGRTWESTDPADTAAGLRPNTSYKFRVAALQPGTRTPGPFSGWLTAKTKK